MDRDIRALVELVPELRGKRVSIAALSGGITNRNYRIDDGDASYVLRIGGEGTDLLGIDRRTEYACTQAASELGIGSEVIAFLPDHAALVTRFVTGRVLEPKEIRRPEILGRVVAALRAYHDGPPGPGAFSPFTTVRAYHALAVRHGVSFPTTIAPALDALGAIEAELRADDPPCPCHNDLLPSNFIDDGERIRIIDWEYAGMGDRFFDLGNLAVNNEFGTPEERLLLDLYFGAARPEHLRRLHLMRLASDMREALWGFLQSGISSLDFDFLAYGHKHLNRFLESAGRNATVAVGGEPS